MDCNTARLLATFIGRPATELDVEDAASFDAHISSCPDCAARLEADRAFDARIGQAMRNVPVPAGLATRLLDGVSAQQGTWYRQKAYALIGIAASIALVAGGIVAWQMGTTSDLSLNTIVQQAENDEQNRSATIDRALSRHDLAFNPVRNFDLTQLEFVGTGELNGKQVPVLYFVNGAKNARAKVYVVRDADFKWKGLPQDGASTMPSLYGFQVAVLNDRTRGDVGYIVVFTGSGLDLFLESHESL